MKAIFYCLSDAASDRCVKQRRPHQQSCGSGLILTGSGSNLSDKPDPDPTSQDKSDPDPDPDTSVLKIFHLFYDEF